MVGLLRIVAGVCLLTVWLIFGGIISQDASGRMVLEGLAVAVLISFFSVILYAFARVLDDVRDMRDNVREARYHLEIMRKYYDLGKNVSH
jgi:hypothetical protein